MNIKVPSSVVDLEFKVIGNVVYHRSVFESLLTPTDSYYVDKGKIYLDESDVINPLALWFCVCGSCTFNVSHLPYSANTVLHCTQCNAEHEVFV